MCQSDTLYSLSQATKTGEVVAVLVSCGHSCPERHKEETLQKHNFVGIYISWQLWLSATSNFKPSAEVEIGCESSTSSSRPEAGDHFISPSSRTATLVMQSCHGWTMDYHHIHIIRDSVSDLIQCNVGGGLPILRMFRS